MDTRKPLKDMIPELLTHFHNHADYLQANYRIYNILQGQLRHEVAASLSKEILSRSALNRCLQRIPSINLMSQVTDKLSKVYIDKPTRLTNNKQDQEILEEIQRTSEIDSILCEANRLYNSTYSFALEPYIQDSKHKVRVLTSHQFLPYSDSLTNPNEMTVFMKFLGKRKKHVGSEFSDNASLINRKNVREVEIIALYSDKEFLIIDSSGGIRLDIMESMGLSSTRNPFGRIPFVYKSKSKLQLIPYPNKEGLDMSILIPKMLTDLNYAAQFMSHSILWTKNTNLANAELNPDNVINLGDTNPDGGDPEIGKVDPTVDIDMNLKLIQFQAIGYMESRGIKGVKMSTESENPSSGISKAMDEGDITAEMKIQTEFFRGVERDLWNLMADVQPIWAKESKVEERRNFSNEFGKTFRIEYAEMRSAKTDQQKLNEISLWRAEKLMTRKQALREMKPEYTDQQLDDWVKELDEEDKEVMEKALAGLDVSSVGADRTPSNGQFTEGNDAAKNDPVDRENRERDKLVK